MPSDKHAQEEKVETIKAPESAADNPAANLSASLWDSAHDSALGKASASRISSAPPLELVDEKSKKNENTKVAAAESSDAKIAPRKLMDKFEAPPKQEELREANDALFRAAKEAQNQSIWRLPKYIRGLPQPTPDLGCASSVSDRFRRAMETEGSISSLKDSDHRKYYQVNVTEFLSSLTNDNLLKRIDPSEVREGDIIVGMKPGTSSRHMGIVGAEENGIRQSYHNHGGKFIKQSAQERFNDKYPQIEYYRAYLPPKKNG